MMKESGHGVMYVSMYVCKLYSFLKNVLMEMVKLITCWYHF